MRASSEFRTLALESGLYELLLALAEEDGATPQVVAGRALSEYAMRHQDKRHRGEDGKCSPIYPGTGLNGASRGTQGTEERNLGHSALKERKMPRLKESKATDRQVRYLMELLENAGYSIQYVDEVLETLFRATAGRSVEGWLKDLSSSRASSMIDDLAILEGPE